MTRPRPPIFWIKLLLVTIMIVTLIGVLFSAASMALAVTVPLKHPLCCANPASFGAEYENISFSTADGLTLRGWYIPPQNGAVIILIHPYYGDRTGTLTVAEMLYKHGYGLLMYDQRASGESDGDTRSLGWLDFPDVSAATYLLVTRQKDIKIGAYGCSSGGAIAVAGAARTPAIAAIAADAPSPLGWDEVRPRFNLQDPFGSSTLILFYPIVMLRVGTLPTTSMAESIQMVAPRPILFISTGSGEKERIDQFYKLASEPKLHINFPDSSHCAAATTHPAEYEQALVKFFDTTLLNK